jgi:hypothetical protein
MKPRTLDRIALAVAALLLSSCASVPAKRVDTVVHGAVAGDLAARLEEVTVAALPAYTAVERVVRELFPAAAARAGIAPAEPGSRAEYSIWLREEEYSRGIDTYSAVLCVLKLRSKADGSVYATTILADETKLNLKSAAYLYGLLHEALLSLAGSVAASERAAKAAAK